jgi:heptosyltransferase I
MSIFSTIFPRLTPNTHTPQHICLLRLSAIGDVCHTIALLQWIQKECPQTKITWIIGKIEYELVAHLPHVQFIVFDKSQGLPAYIALKKKLNDCVFDLLLHLQVAFRASLVSLCIRAKERWGFDKSRSKDLQWLFIHKKIDYYPMPHVAEGLMQFSKALGAKRTIKPIWNYIPSKEALTWLKQSKIMNIPYVVLSPAASHINRTWGIDAYWRIATYIVEQGFNVYITGSPQTKEMELANTIMNYRSIHHQSQTLSSFKMINLAGKTTLPELSALIAHAHFVIAPDSGPAHMATLVKTTIIGLYAISNPKRTGPYHAIDLCVNRYDDLLFKTTGKTVMNVPWGFRLKGKHLMNAISVGDVIKRIDRVLTSKMDNNGAKNERYS